jgi:hypothetical protein
MKKQTYDLEERLLEYSVRIIKIVEQLPNTRAGNHVAGQLLRSGTSAYPNHGEAQAAEAPFSCPNSSLSIRFVGRAAQLTLTKACFVRRLPKWMAFYSQIPPDQHNMMC